METVGLNVSMPQSFSTTTCSFKHEKAHDSYCRLRSSENDEGSIWCAHSDITALKVGQQLQLRHISAVHKLKKKKRKAQEQEQAHFTPLHRSNELRPHHSPFFRINTRACPRYPFHPHNTSKSNNSDYYCYYLQYKIQQET